MAIQQQILGSGIPPLAASNIAGSVASAQTAVGTNLATALAITTAVVEITSAAASTGAALPLATMCSPGDTILVWNGGANTISIYTQSGETVNNAATSVTIATMKAMLFIKVSATHWVSILTA